VRAARDRAAVDARTEPIAPTRSPWLHSPALDLAMTLCWTPFAAVAWWWQDDASRLAWLVSVTLLISFSHQPVTVALVYGDPRTFDLRRRVFTWSPFVIAAAVLVTRHVSFATLAVVAGVWNAEHTLMQRYGITRIYGRKAGQEEGRVERALLVSWLVLAAVWVAADRRTPDRIEQTGMQGRNRRGLDAVADLGPVARVLLPVVIVAVAVLTVCWLWTQVQRRHGASRPQRWYLASTAALFAVILVNPIAGFLGYIGSHAVEYHFIVHQHLGPRYATVEADGGAAVGRAVRRLGRGGFVAALVALSVGLVALLKRSGNDAVLSVVVLTLGGMHVLYDGFIWKRPSPGKGGMLTSPPS
jgi:hypothetical protein